MVCVADIGAGMNAMLGMLKEFLAGLYPRQWQPAPVPIAVPGQRQRGRA